MKAIILAAGNSQRLRPLTDDRNKGLIKEFDRRSLLEINYENLSRITPPLSGIIIVGGHGIEYLREEVKKLQRQYRLDTALVHNEKYKEMNNCYSLLVGVGEVDDDVLILNSDVLYHPDILSKHILRTQSSLVIDNIEELMPEDMKVFVEGERIVAINKGLEIEKSYGEYIGIATIVRRDIALLRESLEEIVASQPHLYYEDAFQLMFDKTRVGVTNTDGLPWAEVDTHDDLARAKQIYEGLQAERRPVPHARITRGKTAC